MWKITGKKIIYKLCHKIGTRAIDSIETIPNFAFLHI